MKKVIFPAIFCLLLFSLNLFLVFPLFSGEYTSSIGSIESVFIADARFIFNNFPHLSWNQYWYAGFPFHLFYTPFLPYLMALGHLVVTPIPLAAWYRILIGLFYALTPVSLFFLIRYLTKNDWVSFMTSFFFSFFPSFSYFIPGMGSFNSPPWRIVTLILYGEGGHIIGLFWLPLAILFFIKILKEPSFKNIFWAAFFTAALALTNIIALIGYAVIIILLFLTQATEKDWPKKVKPLFGYFLISYGLVAFCYNASFIKASLSIGTGGVKGGGGGTLSILPAIFLFIPVLFILTTILVKIKNKIIFGVGSFVVLFFFSAYLWFKSQVMLLPQPNRYLLEMDMGIAILLAFFFVFLTTRIKKAWLKYLLSVLFIGFTLFFPVRYYRNAWEITLPNPDITKTSEYRIASFLKDNTKGERVYATGSTAFWLNTFADIPQIRGGNDGLANPWLLNATYQVNTGENAPAGMAGESAALWLRALNVSYLVLNLPTSREIYHDYLSPERFATIEGIEEMANLESDVIYRLPLNKPSLAGVVKKSAFVGLTKLKNGVDLDNLKKYVDYIDNRGAKEAEFVWQTTGKAKITANLEKDEAISVQLNYNPGWKATLKRFEEGKLVEKKTIPIKADVIGFIYINPQVTGPVEIDLSYQKTFDVWLGYFLTAGTIVFLIVYLLRKKGNTNEQK
jgi:hypothetical protein